MLRFTLPACAALSLLAVPAMAQTYSVLPGQWEMQGDAEFAGTPLPLEGTECVASGEGEINVDQALREAGLTNCDFNPRSRVGNRTDFTLSCVGEPSFTASGVLTVERKRVNVKADGVVVMKEPM